jgi:hypothetical protein
VTDNYTGRKPGDDADDRFDVDNAAAPGDATRPLELPHRADLTRADQARRAAPDARPRPGDQPESTPARLAAPHPLSRLRVGEPGKTRPKFGLPSFGRSGQKTAGSGSAGQVAGSARQVAGSARPAAGSVRSAAGSARPARQARPALGRPALGRPNLVRPSLGWPTFRRPTLKTAFAFTGIAATLAIVVGLLLTLPNNPAAPVSTGSVYQINWRDAARPPATKFEFGPYFTSFGTSLLMLGTTGPNTTVWSSDDGSTWNQISASDAFSGSGRRFVAQGLSDDGSGGLVAVGNSVGSSSTDVFAAAWHSRDGKTWTPTQVDSAKGQEMIGGVVARPGAVVTAGNSVAWFSPDGQRWTPYLLPGAQNYIPRAVGTWDGGFAIVGLWNGDGGPRSTVWYSTTGRDWVQGATSLVGFDARGIAGLGGRIVAVGSDTGPTAEGMAVSWSSTDGKTWSKSTAPSDQPLTAMDGVTVVDGSFVAIGASDQSPVAGTSQGTQSALSVWVSDDGTTWLPIPTSAPPITHGRLAVAGGHVVLVGASSAGLAMLEGDLRLGPFRTPSPAPSAPIEFALTLKAGDTPMIADVGQTDTLGPVAGGDNKFFTFITQPTGTSIWSSGNGSLWAQEVGPAALVTTDNNGRPVVLQAIGDGHGGVIAIGKVTSPAGDTGTIWFLPKGGKWHQTTMSDPAPPEFTSIAAGPNGFVAASDQPGGSTLMYSVDGETWNAAAIAVANGYSLTVGPYKTGFVATGSDPARLGVSTAWTSTDGRTWTLRPDWHLPINVTQIFSMGNGLVAITSGSGVAPSASATPTPAASAARSDSPSAKPSAAASASTTPPSSWWWSSTGVNWQPTSLKTSGGNWAIVNGQILAFDVPPAGTANWAVWTSADGKNWLRPSSGVVAFGGSTSARIASNGSQVVIVGWAAKGQLKDFYGKFAGR